MQLKAGRYFVGISPPPSLLSSDKMSSEKLFTPFQLTSSITLQHRVVLAPLTRFRADDAGVHGDLAVEYYGQRASEPGTLLITEGTFIGEKGAALKNVPGVWNDEQVKAWKRVRMFLQDPSIVIHPFIWPHVLCV